VAIAQGNISKLRLTLIDVGWGDSIFLESIDSNSRSHYALVDCNDTTYSRSSYIFLKKFFERTHLAVPSGSIVFDWVLLTHAHADHGNGLTRLLKDFGTSRFWYSASPNHPVLLAKLQNFAATSPQVTHHEAVDTSKQLPQFGSASMDVLWPRPGVLDSNENNNSVVLAIALGEVAFVLTGDAEADVVWTQISSQIPSNTKFFKVPHHGARNGTFASSSSKPWLSVLPNDARLGISGHVHPHSHPDASVLAALRGKTTYRTDLHYHICVETDGIDVQVSYSHVSSP
jgi:beta-lactamase superfamily II metal-dependent hydrolase